MCGVKTGPISPPRPHLPSRTSGAAAAATASAPASVAVAVRECRIEVDRSEMVEHDARGHLLVEDDMDNVSRGQRLRTPVFRCSFCIKFIRKLVRAIVGLKVGGFFGTAPVNRPAVGIVLLIAVRLCRKCLVIAKWLSLVAAAYTLTSGSRQEGVNSKSLQQLRSCAYFGGGVGVSIGIWMTTENWRSRWGLSAGSYPPPKARRKEEDKRVSRADIQ